jgi:1-deoxy-D-xylulose-5-phosphate reductoisomerase
MMGRFTELKLAPTPEPEPRRVSVLGSTGSVGCNTLDILRRHPESFEIVALTAHRNVERLIEQARALRPRVAVLADEAGYGALKDGLAGTGIEVQAGGAAVAEAAGRPVDWVMAAIVGAAGLAPALAAVQTGATVALANKECLVCAGDFFLASVKSAGATLLPVDSEHNAIFQVFNFDEPDKVDRIILTASGGPFRSWTRDAMGGATVEQAVAHPNWSMGAKISVDSATLMNKGLELIEAYYLFPVSEARIEVLVHPQSVIHSMVAYVDGSVLAQLGVPDMRTPIAYSLAWPKRMEAPSAKLDLAKIATLSFEEPDHERFPALSLAREALRMGRGAPTVLNAANEIAVAAFLGRRLAFLDIARVVEATLERIMDDSMIGVPGSLEDVQELDGRARVIARSMTERWALA